MSFVRIGKGTFRANRVVSVCDNGDTWLVRVQSAEGNQEVWSKKSDGETIDEIHEELERKSRPRMDAESPQGPGGLT